MAIVITNIPNEVFRFYSDNNINIIEEAVLKGIILPDDVTNGDVIKALFPNISKYNNMLLENHSTNILFDDEWWNAPYKAGDTDGNS